jgi:competence protein ComEA
MLTRLAATAAFAFALALALPAHAATPVNINKADAATIASALDGIGQSKAEAIVAYRTAHGPFKSVDELTLIKGIGKATLERNRGAILFTGASAAAPARDGHRKKSAPATAAR